MNKSKAIGTSCETAVVNYARRNGFANAERRALAGSADLGDILMCPGFIVEVKGGKSAEALNAADIDKWRRELHAEQLNASVAFNSGPLIYMGMLVTKRRGYGGPRAHQWWAHFYVDEWLPLQTETKMWMTTTLDYALYFARSCGYGDPLGQ